MLSLYKDSWSKTETSAGDCAAAGDARCRWAQLYIAMPQLHLLVDECGTGFFGDTTIRLSVRVAQQKTK